ncbi:outer membrane protein assembly factor BamE [Roseitranquillus sediminis]|uniref:outer membrane protein assembly factor BamE n=1 Tax=Roseitranquillus sediminis TaxID=2809051 RepID=UPI001D0C98C1|nr:outer membrane protein assembly factor BamE [Roseitranquillus sediminis]MBM9595014.1 outer membrane protein assembly factor BamE [Roseitranquillus sediminis]
MGLIARAGRLAVVLSFAVAAACTTIYRNHGYVPPDEDLALVDVGDSRAEVQEAVGPPTATGVLTEEGWYYVKSRYREYGWQEPVEVDREVVAISFAGDRVTNVERFGLEEGRVVPISRRVTDRNTTGVGFLQQLFGNLGNFNPADFFNEN